MEKMPHPGWNALNLAMFLLINCCAFNRASKKYVYAVPEESEEGFTIANVSRDVGLSINKMSSRKIRLVSDTSKQYFHLNVADGRLSVCARIDREQLCESEHQCFINLKLVMENPLELFRIQVEVEDINDYAPSFPSDNYNLNIAEFVPPGSRFILEGAQDPDIGTNAVSTYRLGPNEHFVINTHTNNDGTLSVNLVLYSPLDREQHPVHHMVLTALDAGIPPKTGETHITVNVVDANDNAPEFEYSAYTISLLENEPRGTVILRVHATDLDEGQNGDIVYSFSSKTPNKLRSLFALDHKTGDITFNGTADDLDKAMYELYIQASDSAAYALFSVCKVLVEIIDVNNNAPELTVASLFSPVPEDAVPGTVVALITVSDKDSGLNGAVHCSIPDNLPFELTPSFENYVSLVTKVSLDREVVSEYNITVTASDSGSPPQSTQRLVMVHLSDVNDNVPRFQTTPYTVFVLENSPPGASICDVVAIDPDADHNGHVTYSIMETPIQGASVSKFFSIHSESGIIYTQSTFDYEGIKEFDITIEAQDGGLQPLSATLTIKVLTVDQNDNAPEILYPSSMAGSVPVEMVPRSADVGYLVSKVVADDKDSGQNAWLSFHILQATDSSLFSLSSQTGVITTKRSIKVNDAAKQKMTILVKDNGAPSLSSSVILGMLLMDSLPQVLPNFRDDPEEQKFTDLNMYLIISLCSISFLFLGFLLMLLAVKLRSSYTGNQNPHFPFSTCSSDKPDKCSIHVPSQALSEDFLKFAGSANFTQIYSYVSSVDSMPKDAMQIKCMQSDGGKAVHEPKHPNPDWRYSASLRAGVQSSVHMEESAVLRGVPGGLEQQWPTVSSATTEPEGGEVSPPVGAGVNSNSWTFKYGPGNPKQPAPAIPPDFPENFIIPGSPAIISIRQDQPSSQADKSNFITFGKKEETKKKKKKKKGTKTTDKKEKGNSTTDNSDQ